jgi:hypothetical protein
VLLVQITGLEGVVAMIIGVHPELGLVLEILIFLKGVIMLLQA